MPEMAEVSSTTDALTLSVMFFLREIIRVEPFCKAKAETVKTKEKIKTITIISASFKVFPLFILLIIPKHCFFFPFKNYLRYC